MQRVEKLHGVHRKWRVISHPLNTNPFPGSFLNYRGKLRLRDVTINNLTMVEMEGGFDTEHAVSLIWISTHHPAELKSAAPCCAKC